jgi:hypothetical protein
VSRLIALFLLLFACPAWAETAVLKAGDVLRGRFVQERHMQGFATPLRSEGRFVVAPGRGLIWRAETPFAITTVVTPAGLVQSIDGAETSRLSTARLPFLARLYDMLTAALAGDWGGLEGAFTVTRKGEYVVLKPPRPDDPNLPAITARLGRFVDEVEIMKPGGDRDRLLFSEQVLDVRPLDAAEAALLK